MTKKLKSGTPFVYDENDRVVGIRDPHTGTDTDLVTAVTSPGGGVGVSMGLPVPAQGVGSVMYAVAQPAGYLPANGAVYPRASYPELRATVGTVADGIGTWTARTSAADSTWRAITWSPELGLFCAVSYSGTSNRVMTSPDGVNWTARTSAADNDWRAITWSPKLGLFCAVATTGTSNRVMTSPDGVNWTARTSAADNLWASVAWSPELGLFCAVS